MTQEFLSECEEFLKILKNSCHVNVHKVCVLYECRYYLRKIGICLQSNAAKALIIMIIKKMIFTAKSIPKSGETLERKY